MTKDTVIFIKFCAEDFARDPRTAIRYQLFDENGKPLLADYSTDGLLTLPNGRISAISISLDVIKALFDSIVKKKKSQASMSRYDHILEKEPVKTTDDTPLVGAIDPTGLSSHIVEQICPECNGRTWQYDYCQGHEIICKRCKGVGKIQPIVPAEFPTEYE